MHTSKIIAILLVTLGAGPWLLNAQAETVTTQASDESTVFGESYYGDLGDNAPVVALFHQAGGDGRGEYAQLASWLNSIGLRAIAWDLRSGGDRFGAENRTAKAFPDGAGYCEAFPDMQAALQISYKVAKGAPVVIWGSSYSAALVFSLAADHPDKVAAVIAASPASGQPMKECAIEDALPKVQASILALRPRREVDFTKVQAETLIAAGATFHIVENGVHGSSMLVDERTNHDMSADRKFVSSWLSKTLGVKED